MSFPDLYLIRHGETEWNAAGRMQGQLDSALTARGREQARGLNRLLESADLPAGTRAWASPLGRAQETAQLALAGHFAEWTTDQRLAEVNVGLIQGLTLDEAMAGYPELAHHPGNIGWQFHAPGGESFDEFRGRVRSWLADLTAPAVAVTHGITSRMIRAEVMGLGREGVEDLPGGQGMIHVIRDGRASVLAP